MFPYLPLESPIFEICKAVSRISVWHKSGQFLQVICNIFPNYKSVNRKCLMLSRGNSGFYHPIKKLAYAFEQKGLQTRSIEQVDKFSDGPTSISGGANQFPTFGHAKQLARRPIAPVTNWYRVGEVDFSHTTTALSIAKAALEKCPVKSS